MRVGVDLDGVLYPFVAVFRDWVATRRWVEADTLPWPDRWDFYPDWGMTKREFYDGMDESIGAGFLFTVGAPEAGARAVLRRLRKAGHTVHVVTARHKTAAAATQGWLATHRLPVDGLHFTADKTTVRLDAHIDDTVKHYDQLDAAGVPCWLMDQTWNRGHPGRRVTSLSEWCDAVLEHDVAAVVDERGVVDAALAEAVGLVFGDREAEYGHPSDDLTATGRIWGGQLSRMLRQPVRDLTPEEVSQLMRGVKLSRQAGGHKDDNLVDEVGYVVTELRSRTIRDVG